MSDRLSSEEIQRIVESCHDAPRSVLGPHEHGGDSGVVVRAFIPDATQVAICDDESSPPRWKMQRLHEDGLFEAIIADPPGDFDYAFLVTDTQGETHHCRDPYALTDSRFSARDEADFRQGTHLRLFEHLGSHSESRGSIDGVNFAVWAPNAQRVSVVGTFNRWDGRRHQMQRLSDAGVWELFVPEAVPGALYKFEIKTAEGQVFLKTDPMAERSETPSGDAAQVHDPSAMPEWHDGKWMEKRNSTDRRDRPVSLYELDAATELLSEDQSDPPRTYRDLAIDELIAAVRAGGCTDVLLRPWSAARTGAGLLGPDPRLGSPADLMAFVDTCHRHGVGVILDTVSSRFGTLPPALAWFDGSPLYEGPAAEGSASFDLTLGEVRSFLLSSIHHWLERYHLDGVRMEAALAPSYRDLRGKSVARGAVLLVAGATDAAGLSTREIERIVAARHEDPYAILGAHADGERLRIRALAPKASGVHILVDDQPELLFESRRIHPDGLFESAIAGVAPDCTYKLRVLGPDAGSHDQIDPYALDALVYSEYDQHLYAQGNHYDIYHRLGAHPREAGSVAGTGFAVWAPNASGVSVVGPFNDWDGRCHQMKRHGECGVWEVFLPGLGTGDIYKFEIRAANGDTFLKSDPFAFLCEVSPGTANIVYEPQGTHEWCDSGWMEWRARTNTFEHPLCVYELHLGSWKRDDDDQPLSYRQLAEELVPYVKKMGFTHIELLPVAEYPYEPSWGYQVSNYYAPTSRHGTPADLMYFVDTCHQSGIGVLLDWVPGHFPKDAHALAWFDGTCLYEHADPRKGEHADWGTLVFNYGRHEVENFLIANALYWIETFHFDGLRVDAVASMLYLDYSRGLSGDWIPNEHGGNENLEAIEFLRHTNAIVHERFPGILMIAEESTAWPLVSRPTDQGGLGFGYKWNMGWMHDVLFYLSRHPDERRHHHNKLTFGIHYAFQENFILSLSHDEVVHLKGSLLAKMPGTEWEKFANLRLLFAFMYAHPGKKLFFMGGEFGQPDEWNHARGLNWGLLDHTAHGQLSRYICELNNLYRTRQAMHQVDFCAAGFEWMDVDNAEDCVLAFVRKAKDPRDPLLFVFNFSLISRPAYRVGVPYPVTYTEIFDSNSRDYGGLDNGRRARQIRAEEIPAHGQQFSLVLALPALSAVALEPAALQPINGAR